MPAARPSCVVCGDVLDAENQLVLARGSRRAGHCSETCLGETLRKHRLARAVRRRRAAVGLSLVAVMIAGAWTWRRHRAPHPVSISYAWSGTGWEKSGPAGPVYFGPNWPPTDEDWTFAFARAGWVYPLPGPARRASAAHDRIFGGEPAGHAVCRKPGACGVTLGGQLWGEHVYAALDGVVDHAHGEGSDERGGGYVRIAHFGGMAFTQYFHLAAVPRGIVRGARVSAGEVIGLVGDTGIAGERTASGSPARAHLHFALSIRPRSDLPEIYWDPAPLMADWPLHVPPHGTVAGLVAATDAMETPRRHRAR